jgi:hypothetical protein
MVVIIIIILCLAAALRGEECAEKVVRSSSLIGTDAVRLPGHWNQHVFVATSILLISHFDNVLAGGVDGVQHAYTRLTAFVAI